MRTPPEHQPPSLAGMQLDRRSASSSHLPGRGELCDEELDFDDDEGERHESFGSNVDSHRDCTVYACQVANEADEGKLTF